MICLQHEKFISTALTRPTYSAFRATAQVKHALKQTDIFTISLKLAFGDGHENDQNIKVCSRSRETAGSRVGWLLCKVVWFVLGRGFFEWGPTWTKGSTRPKTIVSSSSKSWCDPTLTCRCNRTGASLCYLTHSSATGGLDSAL